MYTIDTFRYRSGQPLLVINSIVALMMKCACVCYKLEDQACYVILLAIYAAMFVHAYCRGSTVGSSHPLSVHDYVNIVISPEILDRKAGLSKLSNK